MSLAAIYMLLLLNFAFERSCGGDVTEQPPADQPRPCTVTVTEIRKIRGHCESVTENKTVCVSENGLMMDPTNHVCKEVTRSMAGSGRVLISCVIEEQIENEISGYCKRIGTAVPACVTRDETVMDPFNLECL